MLGKIIAHQCALVEKGGKCCEGAALQQGRCVLMPIFGIVVVLALAAIIILQVKTLKALGKSGKKK